MPPLVSIITPVYNGASFLKDTVQSVLNQTYSNWELLLINDGSTDNSFEVIQEFITLDEKIKYYDQSNAGQARARNKGIQLAQGKYIAFLDQDDLWAPNKLKVQIELIENTDTHLVFSDSYVFRENIYEEKLGRLNVESILLKGESGLRIEMEQNRIPMLTVLVLKEALVKVNYLSEKKEILFADDYHLWLKLLKAGYVLTGVDEPLTYYRLHSQQASAKDYLCVPQVIQVLHDIGPFEGEMEQFRKKCLLTWYYRLTQRYRPFSKEKFHQVLEEYSEIMNEKGLAFCFFLLKKSVGYNISEKIFARYIRYRVKLSDILNGSN